MDPYPHLNAPADGFVFVLTYGRSGSTLLQALLNTIPGYCIRGEHANSLKHLFNAWSAIRHTPMVRDMRALRNAERTATPSKPDHPWYGAELSTPFDYARSLADVFVREILQLPAGTRVGGFKEIRYHENEGSIDAYLDFLAHAFPKSRFIINKRDLGAVGRSGWWANLSSEAVARHLAPAERAFDHFAARQPRRTIELRYEEYVAVPVKLSGLYAFLGEPFDPQAVDQVLQRRLDHAGVDLISSRTSDRSRGT